MWGGSGNVYRNELVGQFHKVLFRNNVGVDFIFLKTPGSKTTNW